MALEGLAGKLFGELWGVDWSNLEELINHVMRIVQEHYDDAVRDIESHWVSEYEDLKDRCSELETELMLERNDFGTGMVNVKLKKHGRF